MLNVRSKLQNGLKRRRGHPFALWGAHPLLLSPMWCPGEVGAGVKTLCPRSGLNCRLGDLGGTQHHGRAA